MVEFEAAGSPAAATALRRSRWLRDVLDEAVRVPGTDYRVGIDPIVGLLPIGGDLLGLVLSLYPVVEAVRLGLPRWTVTRMVANVAIDAAVGSIPLVGTVFDVVWKATDRNVDLLERALSEA